MTHLIAVELAALRVAAKIDFMVQELSTTASASQAGWPDLLDGSVTTAFFAIVFGMAALGYVCMVLDFRAYLRSLRRALVVISGYRLDLPEWVRRDTPQCILAFGLTMPCTTDDVLSAYRRKVKQLHPDHGGDRRAFLRLQAHFEQAMELLTNK